MHPAIKHIRIYTYILSQYSTSLSTPENLALCQSRHDRWARIHLSRHELNLYARGSRVNQQQRRIYKYTWARKSIIIRRIARAVNHSWIPLSGLCEAIFFFYMKKESSWGERKFFSNSREICLADQVVSVYTEESSGEFPCEGDSCSSCCRGERFIFFNGCGEFRDGYLYSLLRSVLDLHFRLGEVYNWSIRCDIMIWVCAEFFAKRHLNYIALRWFLRIFIELNFIIILQNADLLL